MHLTRKLFNKIVDRIEFRFYEPHEPLPDYEDEGVLDPFAEYNAKIMGRNIPVHVVNTIFGPEDAETLRDLSALTGVLSMSTIAIAFIIFNMTKYLEEDECYVNIGVWKGYTFFAGVLNRAVISIGVDDFSEFGSPADEFTANYEKLAHSRSAFFRMDYLEYLERIHKQKIGIYFYDGEHSYENQMKALEIAERFFGTNAIIIVDDSNYNSTRGATLDFLKNRHGKYELLFDQFTAANGHPTFHNGLMIIRKVG